MLWKMRPHSATPNILALICFAVLCIILTLGLWPFHAPTNGVSWLKNQNGLRVGKYGSIISSRPFQLTPPQQNPGATLEIWLQPRRIWEPATFLTFFSPDSFRFSLRQSQIDLQLRAEMQPGAPQPAAASLYVKEVFRKPRPVFITVATAARGAWIYVDGALAAASPQFPLSAKTFNGRLILGDSSGQSDSWSGQLLGFAVYRRPLTNQEVLHNYRSWMQNGRPAVSAGASDAALYLFDERSGDVVHSKSAFGVDLNIPLRYQVIGKISLEPFWSEFNMSGKYWKAVLKNIAGFIPFGFFFYACLATRVSHKRAMLLTVILGAAVSLTIETLQIFLPTRDSGTTDLITNTLGTAIGAVLYNLLAPSLARLLRVVVMRSPEVPVPHRVQ